MSVTFYVGHASVWPDGQQGVDYRKGEPTVNFANENCAALLRLLELPNECYGSIKRDDLAGVRRRIVVLLNSQEKRAQETRPPREESGVQLVQQPGFLPRIEPKARYFFGGISDEYLCRRLRDLDVVLSFAQESGADEVYWT